MPRAYSSYEIRRAIEDYMYDKKGVEMKYKATPSNFFGGEKFYIKHYLNPQQETPAAPISPLPTHDAGGDVYSGTLSLSLKR
jgi:hypothetical protein